MAPSLVPSESSEGGREEGEKGGRDSKEEVSVRRIESRGEGGGG